MRALVTGANGFAGRYLCRELIMHGYSVTETDCFGTENIIKMNLLDMDNIMECIKEAKPDVIFNLGGFASVAASWKTPQEAINVNVIGAVNLMEAVRSISPDIKLLLIGSSDQYGRTKDSTIPVDETCRLDPVSPYAISKRCQEDMGKTYADVYGMNICMTRTFNHIGIGQRLGFVVTDFAYGISEIEKGNADQLNVGNLSSKRCFTDVRDAVSAYRLIAEKGKKGRIYNVGSEKIYSIEEILNILLGFSKAKIQVSRDTSKLRSFDLPYIQCDNTLLKNDTGWEPAYPIEQTLLEILNYFRDQNGGGEG